MKSFVFSTDNMVDNGGTACLSIHNDTSFVFNILIHILILFTILSFIFIFVISKAEQNAFKDETQDAIGNNLPLALKQYDKDGSLKQVLKQLPLDKLQQLYDHPDESTTVYNQWLFRSMFVIIGGLIIIILIPALMLWFSCGTCLPFLNILRDNAIIFLLVGMIEVIFFLFIAKRYIPAPPSLLVSQVFDDLKNW